MLFLQQPVEGPMRRPPSATTPPVRLRDNPRRPGSLHPPYSGSDHAGSDHRPQSGSDHDPRLGRGRPVHLRGSFLKWCTNGNLRCSDVEGLTDILSAAACGTAAQHLGLRDTVVRIERITANYPVGCYWYANELLFNPRRTWTGELDTCLWCNDSRFDSICARASPATLPPTVSPARLPAASNPFNLAQRIVPGCANGCLGCSNRSGQLVGLNETFCSDSHRECDGGSYTNSRHNRCVKCQCDGFYCELASQCRSGICEANARCGATLDPPPVPTAAATGVIDTGCVSGTTYFDDPTGECRPCRTECPAAYTIICRCNGRHTTQCTDADGVGGRNQPCSQVGGGNDGDAGSEDTLSTTGSGGDESAGAN